ncbi:MAG: hypothetical protein ACRDRZ_00530, partial [Pseudonocardiaceae bacterium]
MPASFEVSPLGPAPGCAACLVPGSVLGRPVTLDPQGPELIHGRNPSDPDFGGRTFTSDPGTPLVIVEPGPWYQPWETDVSFSMDAHSQYWGERSASLRNIAAIITDHDDR